MNIETKSETETDTETVMRADAGTGRMTAAGAYTDIHNNTEVRCRTDTDRDIHATTETNTLTALISGAMHEQYQRHAPVHVEADAER